MRENKTIEKQIKFAVVLYGGGSLAIYINGVAQELLKLVQATADGTNDLTDTTAIYRKIAFFMTDEDLQRDCREKLKTSKEINEVLENKLKTTEPPKVQFVIDVLTGTSAGGINAVFLAKALVNGAKNMDDLRDLWLEQGDFAKLLNDKQSVADNNLNAPQEPTSLLNSQRMYLELLKALDGLDKNAKDGKPLVKPLDLYVTYTDFEGLPMNLALSDKTVLERSHKRVFNFRFENETNDFEEENNPFLAFAARCTSSFPIAFEPMKLTDIDEIIEFALPKYEKGKSDRLEWKKYFRDLTDENGKTIEWENRSFVDGGCLDNKPFGYAIDKLTQRADEGIVERKLIYIEPAPEEFQISKTKDTKPNALENLFGQASGLPRYETIREDLRRVLDRNRLIERVTRLIAEVEGDFGRNPKWLKKLSSKKIDWSIADLNDVAEQKGAAFLPYYRLRVSATTDDIARLVTRYFKIDDDSDYFKVLRCLVRVWREKNFHEYRINSEDNQTFNNFLYQYDVEYRLRRLRFVIQKAEYMLRCKTEFLKSLAEFGQTNGQTLRSEDSEKEQNQIAAAENVVANKQGVLSAKAALINALPGKIEDAEKASNVKLDPEKYIAAVIEMQSELNRIYLQLRRDHEFLYEGLSQKDADIEFLSDSQKSSDQKTAPNFAGLKSFRTKLKKVKELLCKFESEIEKAESVNEKNSSSVWEKPSTPEELKTARAKLSIAALERILNQISRRKQNGCDEIADANCKKVLTDAYSEKFLGAIEGVLNEAATTLNKEIYNKTDSFLRRASEQAKDILGIDYKGQTFQTPANLTDEAQFARNYLKNFYELFDSYDQISFPIYFESPVGEAVKVDVVRISSRDAQSLINEENPDECRRKLAGDYLFAFGAFLDPRWRLNDIMWGRLDGAERLITTLLPEAEYADLCALLTREANEAILAELLMKKASANFQGTLVDALTLASTEAIERQAVDKLVLKLKTGEIQTGLTEVLKTALNQKPICDYVTSDYEVNRRLEPQPTLDIISRTTQIGGKILQDIAEKQAQAGSRLSWIARLGQIFWGLVTVAAPNSIWNLLFVYWIQLLYLFETVVIVGATIFAKPDVQQFGIVSLIITLGIHLTVISLHDEMLGDKFWKTLLRFLTGGVLAIFVIVGVLFFYSVFFDDQVWNAITNLRATISQAQYARWQKLIPIVPFALLFVVLALWREAEKLNLQVIGRVIIIGFLAIVAFSLYFGELTGASPGHAPMIDLEFVSDAKTLQEVINNLGKHLEGMKTALLDGMKTALWLDTFAFVPLYWGFLVILSGLLNRRRQQWASGAAITAAICASGAALADLAENYFSLFALSLNPSEISDQTAKCISVSAQIKWTLIFIALGILSSIFLRFERRNLWNALSLLLLIGAVTGIIGIFLYPRILFGLPIVNVALIMEFLILVAVGTAFQAKFLRQQFLRGY